MTTTTVEPSVSVTTPSLHEPELKSPPNQYELQPYPEVPDVAGEPVTEVHIPVYPSPAYSTGCPQPPTLAAIATVLKRVQLCCLTVVTQLKCFIHYTIDVFANRL